MGQNTGNILNGNSALVQPRQKELVRPETHAGIDIDNVEPGGPRSQRRSAVPAPEICNISLVHGAGLDRMQAAYTHAIATGYRFYSYGDACLLQRMPS